MIIFSDDYRIPSYPELLQLTGVAFNPKEVLYSTDTEHLEFNMEKIASYGPMPFPNVVKLKPSGRTQFEQVLRWESISNGMNTTPFSISTPKEIPSIVKSVRLGLCVRSGENSPLAPFDSMKPIGEKKNRSIYSLINEHSKKEYRVELRDWIVIQTRKVCSATLFFDE